MGNGTLLAEPVGLVTDVLLEAGLERARAYFEQRGLNPSVCYMDYLKRRDGSFSCHWMAAELQANAVLWEDPTYRNSRILLGIDPCGHGDAFVIEAFAELT